jgi:hypothetical protein
VELTFWGVADALVKIPLKNFKSYGLIAGEQDRKNKTIQVLCEQYIFGMDIKGDFSAEELREIFIWNVLFD